MTRLPTAAALLLGMCCGCKHPPQAPQPVDPLPWDHYEDSPPPELLEQVQLLTEQTQALSRRLDQMDSELESRNAELKTTRKDYELAVSEIGRVRRELAQWQDSLGELQRHLAEQDEQRLEALAKLVDRINEVSRSVGQ